MTFMIKNLFSIKNDLSPLLKLVIPLALTGIVQSSAYFFETLFLAHLTPDVLAAGALVSWLFATLAVIFFGTLSSVNILVSLKYGANDHERIGFILRDGIILAIVFSIPAFLFCWYITPVLLFFHQPPSIVSLAQSYLYALAWGMLPSFVEMAFLELLIGLGHARAVMVFSFLSVGQIIFFSYALIFGEFGFDALGIAGAGWGMTISYWLTAIVVIIYVLLQKKYRIYVQKITSFSKPSYLLELIKIGFPIGAMYCVEVGFFLVLTLMMGSLGSQFLAANQIAMQYLGLFMSVIFSIAQAITVRMGHLLGANENTSAKKAAYLGVSLSAVLMVLVAIFGWAFPTVFVSADLNIHDPKNFAVANLAMQFLIISMFFQIFEAARIALFGALRALKDTHFTLLTSAIGFWGVSLPVGYFFATKLQLGGQGLWWGMILGVIISVILLALRFKLKMQKYDELT